MSRKPKNLQPHLPIMKNLRNFFLAAILVALSFVASSTAFGGIDLYFDTFYSYDNNRIELNSDRLFVLAANIGETTENVTISFDADYVSIDGASTKELTIPTGTTIGFWVVIDRTALSNDYYMFTIFATTETEVKSSPIFVQSGVAGEGYTYYRSHFNDFETGTDIRDADSAWSNASGAPDFSPIVEMNGEKVLQMNLAGIGGFNLKCNSINSINDNYNYKISFKCYFPEAENITWQYNLDFSNNPSEVFLRYDDNENGYSLTDSFGNKLINKVCPFKSWVDVSYTFTFDQNDPRLICATFGGVTSNLNQQISASYDGENVLNYFKFLNWGDSTVYVKDVIVEAEPIRLNIEQPAHGSIAVSPVKALYSRNDVVTIAVSPEEGYRFKRVYTDDFKDTRLVSTYTVTHETFVRADITEYNLLFKEDFESYNVGTEVVGNVEGWAFSSGTSGASTIVMDNGNKVMKVGQSGIQQIENLDLYSPSFLVKGNHPFKELTKISFRIAELSGYSMFFFVNDNNPQQMLQMMIDSENNYMSGTVSGDDWFSFENFYSNGRFNDFYLIYDALENKLVEIGLNGQSQRCSIPMTDLEYAHLGFELWQGEGGIPDIYLDDILVETNSRYDSPMIYTPDLVYIPYGSDNLNLTIYNGGPSAEISYTISSDAGWLTISPASGVFTESAEILFQADIKKPEGCYEANVTFNSGIYGSRTIKLIWQNGFIYQSHFDQMQLGDILPQDERWSTAYGAGRDDITMDIVSGGSGSNANCLKIHTLGWSAEEMLRFANVPKGTNFIMRVSFDFKTDTEINDSINFGSRDCYDQFYLSNSHYGAGFYYSSSMEAVEYPGDHIGEWIHLSYTLTVNDNDYFYQLFQIGDSVLTNDCSSSRDTYYSPTLSFSFQENQAIYLDNIQCEIVSDKAKVFCDDPVGGTLTIAPEEETYYKGDVLTVIATPDPGYELESVYCDDFSSTNLVSSYTLTHTVFFQANFNPRKYRLSLNSTSRGSATASPQKESYDYNETVTLSATPDEGCDFLCFTGTVYSTDQTTVITMNQHHDILAMFKKDNNILTLNVGDNGHVTVSPQKDTYAYNETVTLTAIPDEGYAFGGFTGTASSTDSTMVITMDQDHDITASFFYDSYTLDLTVGEHGNVTVSPEKATYHYNEKVTLTAVPDDDYAFSGFTGTASSSEATMEITMDQDHAITAGFYFDAYRLSVSVVSHGSVTISPEKEKYHFNETVTLTAVPDEYYEFQGFSGTASSTSLSMTVTMDQDHDIVATFYTDLIPDNDDVANAALMTIGTDVYGNNQYGTLEEGEEEAVGWQHSLWYKFNLGNTDLQNVIINVNATEGSELDAAIVIATGTGFADFNYIAVQDTGLDETFKGALEGNVDYYLGVYSWDEYTFGEFVITSSSVPIKDWYCSPNGTGSGDSFDDPCDLKTAIANVPSGKTVYMAPGTYSLTKEGTTEIIQFVEDNYLAIKTDNVSVIGSGSDQTIIYCERPMDVGVVLMAPGITLKGVQIDHPFNNKDNNSWGGATYCLHAALNITESANVEDVLVHVGNQGDITDPTDFSLIPPVTIQLSPGSLVNVKNCAFISEGLLGACGVRPFSLPNVYSSTTQINFDFCTFRNGTNDGNLSTSCAIYGTTWYGNRPLTVNVNDCVFLNDSVPVGESGSNDPVSWEFNVNRCFMPGADLSTNNLATITYTDCDNVIDPLVDANWHSPLVKAGFKNSIPLRVYATVLDEDFSSYEEGDVKGQYGWSDNFGSNGEIVAVKDGDNTYLEIKPTGFWGARYDFENPVQAGWAGVDNPYSSWIISSRMKLSETDSFLNVFIANPETGIFSFRKDGDHYKIVYDNESLSSNLELPIDAWFDFSIEFFANTINNSRVLEAISVNGCREELGFSDNVDNDSDIFSAFRFFFSQEGMTLSLDSLKIEYLTDVPPNDYFSRAFVYDESGAVTGNNEEARIEAGENPDSRNTVWYSFDSEDNGAVTFTTAGSWDAYANDTMLAVYSADTATPTIWDLTEVVPPTNEGRDEAVTFNKKPGKYYFISVGSAEGAGEFTLSHEWIGSYTLNLTTEGQGSVTVTPLKETYHLYEDVTITATPDTDYTFDSYSGTVSSTNWTIVVSMEQDHDITATFPYDIYYLNLTTTEGGTVTVSPEKDAYHWKESVTLTAAPELDYGFDGYTGTTTSTNLTMEVTMDQDQTITAEFYFDAYKLNLTVGDHGTVAISPEKETYHRNEVVTLTATPDTDYAFEGYTGTASSTNLVMEITMDQDYDIAAEFYFDAYTLNLNIGSHGNVAVIPNKEKYHFNETVKLIALPDDEYAFSGFTGTESSTNLVMDIVMYQHQTISARFYFDAYRLNLSIGANGNVLVNPNKETYHLNEKVTLTAIPDDEYAFSGFTGTANSTNLVIEIVMDQHHTIAARYYFDAYRLNLNIGANGSVAVSPDKETYHRNEKVTLTATPDSEYAFEGYTGTVSSTNQVIEITMNQHYDIAAEFYFDAYRINLETTAGGSVALSPEKETYHRNEVVTLTATPDAEYAFEGYTGTAESTNLVMQITMNQHYDIAAEFYFDAYRINLEVGPNGSVAVSPEKETYHRNEVVTLTATPDAEYAFEGYTGTVSSTNQVIEITMNQHYDIAAEFYFDAYRINLEVGPNGSVAVSPEKETYHRNEVVTLTATPDAEHAFEGYSGTVNSTNAVIEITMNQHYDIAAEFYFDAYRINLEVGPNGSVAVAPEKETYHRNEKVTLTATPDVEYAFEGYTGTVSSTNQVIEITMNQHYDIAAEFYFDAYRINLEVGPNGTVAVSPEKETYHRNEVVTLTATPDAEYAFEGYTGTAESTNLVIQITMNQHYDITAEFYFDAYRINLEVGPNGSVAVSPEKETYHRNEKVTLTATPDAEYAFEGYTGTVSSTNQVIEITMNQHYDITAEFYFDAYRINLEVGPNGSVAVSPEKDTYHRNEVVTLTATPDAEYAFEGYTGTVNSTNAVIEITMNQHYDIAAEFYFDAYRINLEVGPNGSVAVSPEKDTYHRNEKVTLTATPDAEYAFEGYTGTVNSTNAVIEIVMNQHYDIAAEFYFDAYRLTLNVGENGTVTVAPEKETYHRNEKVTLTATPDAEYAFEGYTGTAESTNLVMEITMNQHHDIAAEFYFDAYKLNLTVGENGTVTVAPEKETYHRNEKVTLTATPDAEYAFEGYTGTAESTNLVMEITMNQHHDIAAEFYFDAYRLTLNVGENGTVTVAPEKETYHRNEKVTLTATPDAEYAFEGYTGTAESTNLVMEITMNQHHDIAAEFYFDAYRLTLNVGENGTVAVSPEKETYHRNEKVTLTATPDAEYAFEGYTGTAESTNLVMEITMNQHHDIAAEFYFDAYKLNLTVGENGTVTVAPEKETYHRNEKVTLTATPDAEYAFEGYTGTAESTNLVMEITMNQHHEIAAEFYFDAYKLNLTVGENGSVAVSPEKETYHRDEKVTLTATPDAEYAFEGYTGTVSSTNAVIEIVMNQHYDIAAEFYFDAYKLNLTVGANGTVTVAPEKETYHRDEKVTLTAAPDDGYAFSGYTGTAESTNLVMEITMNQHHEIGAEFYFDAYRLQVTAGEGGSVSYDPVKETYNNEEEVTITATPEVGYAFANYSGTVESSENPLVIKMTQHHEVTANFTNLEYVVTCETAVGGSVTFSPQQSSYHYKDEITYTVETENGYHFIELQGYEEVLTNLTGTIVVTEAYTLTPVFELDEYSVTLSSTFGGTIELEPSKETYHYNDVVTVKDTPDEGYVLSKLLANGEELESSSYTIAGDAEIKAVFVYGDKKPSGEGTEDAPYEIANVANLVWLSRNTQSAAGSYSVLTSDIDLTICADWMDGLGFEPIGSLEAPFQGSFDGANFTIKGLYINDPELEAAGLFGYVKNSEVKNLKISESEVTAAQNAGLLFGTGSSCSVERVAVSGKTYAESNSALLIGCADTVTIELTSAEGYAEGGENVGGMIGFAKESEINNAYTVANVSGQNNVGGFVGSANYTTVAYGYAAGSASSAGAQGGVFGKAEQSKAVSVFFDKAQAKDNGFGKPVAAEDLLKRETYGDWDFINIWVMEDGVARPVFRGNDGAWTIQSGTTLCKINLSGVLTPDAYQAVTASQEVCLYASNNDTLLVEPKLINVLPVKENGLKITYNQKKRCFKYTSNAPKVTLGVADGQVLTPCEYSKPKRKLNFTATLNQDISATISGKKICLSDDRMDLHALSGTKVKLLFNGRSYTYKGQVGNVTLQITLSPKNRKFNLKYSAPNTVNLVTEN